MNVEQRIAKLEASNKALKIATTSCLLVSFLGACAFYNVIIAEPQFVIQDAATKEQPRPTPSSPSRLKIANLEVENITVTKEFLFSEAPKAGVRIHAIEGSPRVSVFGEYSNDRTELGWKKDYGSFITCNGSKIFGQDLVDALFVADIKRGNRIGIATPTKRFP